MCSVTSFYHVEILMFTRNPSTGERYSKYFDNEMYVITKERYLLIFTNVALITKEWGDGQNNDLLSTDFKLRLLDNSNELS